MASPPFAGAGAEAGEEFAVPRKRRVLANTHFLSLLLRAMPVLPVLPGAKAPPVCRVCPESVVLPACQVPRVTEYVSPKILMSPLGPPLPTIPVPPSSPPQGWMHSPKPRPVGSSSLGKGCSVPPLFPSERGFGDSPLLGAGS